MTPVQLDFLGPFVECNGWIHRPLAASTLAAAATVTACPERFSPQCRVSDGRGHDEAWSACGSVDAYREARDQLSPSAFEHFAAMACGRALAPHAAPAQPRLRRMFPNGRVDLADPSFKVHLQHTKALEYAAYARVTCVEMPSQQQLVQQRGLRSVGGGHLAAAESERSAMEWVN